MIIIALAALNEATNLEKIIVEFSSEICKLQSDNNKISQRDLELKQYIPHFIICIDGSSDNSQEIISKLQDVYPITLLPPQNTRGLGLAFGRIFDYFLNNYHKGDILITLDADLTHQSADLSKLMMAFKTEKHDLIIGSRFCNGSKISGFPLFRIFISRSVAILLKILTFIITKEKSKINDYTSGYRIYKFEKLQELQTLAISKKESLIEEVHFTYTVEILLKLIRLKANIYEVGIDYCYKNKIGKSKLNFFNNFVGLISLILRFFFMKNKSEGL